MAGEYASVQPQGYWTLVVMVKRRFDTVIGVVIGYTKF